MSNSAAGGSVRRHSATLFFLIVVLLCVFFAWRHYARVFRWEVFKGTMHQLDWRWVLAGTGLALLSYIGRAIRWKVMMLPAPSRIGSLCSATLAGFASVVILGRAGELVRPYLIARDERSTFASQAAIWLLERLYDLLFILVLFGIGLSQASAFGLPTHSRLAPVLQTGGWILTVTAVAAAGILYLLGHRPEACRRRILEALAVLPERFQHKITESLDSFLQGARSPGILSLLLTSLLLTAIEWSIIVAAVWCYFQAHPDSATLEPVQVAAYVGFVSLGNIIQLPGIGGGAQLASIVILTELFHQPIELATGLSLLVWAGTALVVLPFGVPLAFFQHLRLSDLRKIEDESPI